MTHFEEELRAAMVPLAGDPHEVAGRVMAKLPASRWRRAPRLAVLSAAAAAGVAAGMLFDAWVAPAPAVTDPATLAKPAMPVTPAQPTPPPQVVSMRNAVLRTVIGRVTATALGAEMRTLAPLASFEPGERLETHAASYAEVVLANGTAVRLNAESALSLADDRVLRLERGQVWVRFSGEPQLIHHPQGRVEVDGEATVDLRGNSGELVVVTLEGSAMLVSSDETRRRVKTMHRCSVRGGILRNREVVYWPFEVIAWQLALLCGEAHAEDTRAMAKHLIGTLDHPSFYSMGEDGLRQMGPCAMDPLLGFLADTDVRRDRQVRRRAARLLTDVAVFRGLDGLFGHLADIDPDVRVSMYRAIHRVTGIERINERFWSSAPEQVREEELRAWRDDLRERK